MSDPLPFSTVDPEQAADNLINSDGLVASVRWAVRLLAVLRERATKAREEIDSVLGEPHTPAKARPSTLKRPDPPTTATEAVERVRDALATEPRPMRGLTAVTGLSVDAVFEILTGLGATKTGRKWSLPRAAS